MVIQHLQTKDLDLLKQHAFKWAKPDNFKAWKNLVACILLQLVALYLINHGYVVGVLFRSFVLMKFLIILHDIGHYSYFSTIPVNRFFGAIIGVYIWNPFDSWRMIHNTHHKYFGNIDAQEDFTDPISLTKKKYESMTGVTKFLNRLIRQPIVNFLVMGPFLVLCTTLPLTIKNVGLFNWGTLQTILSIVLTFYIMPLLGVKWEYAFFSIWLMVVFLWMILHLNHSVNRAYRVRGKTQTWNEMQASVLGSTHIPLHWLLEFFVPGLLSYHFIHHINTLIPSYALDDCFKSFGKQNLDRLKVQKVPAWKAIKSLANTMWDEEKQQLITFNYSLF